MADFKTFHDGPPLGLLEKACLASFEPLGHSITVYTYEAYDLPLGVRQADAADVIPVSERHAFFKHAPGRISQFSNGFRYRMLATYGGWWVDTDVLCMSTVMPDTDLVLGWASDRSLVQRVGSAIMRFPLAHKLPRQAAEFWREHWTVSSWGVTGPKLITSLVHELDLLDHIMPFGSLYQTNWNQSLLLFDSAAAEEASATVADCPLLHLANSGFGFTGLMRNIIPPRGSMLRPFIEPYLTEWELAEGDAAFTTAIVSAFRRLKAQHPSLV